MSRFADDAGLHVDAPEDSVLDLYFDGRRIWSVATDQGKRDESGCVHVAWPERMRRKLDGFAFVEVRLSGEDLVLASGTASFGSGEDPLDFTDEKGRPITLNKWGRFTHTFDTTPREVVEAYLDEVERVLRTLQEDAGVDAFISFGTLLGAVREGALIAHDVDVDVGYLSRYTHPPDVAREQLKVERTVRALGHRVVRQNGGFLALFIPQPDGSQRNLDIFTAFFVEGMLYQVNDIGTPARIDDVLPLTSISLEGRSMPAPARPEIFLEAAYGEGWRVPDPGFTFARERAVQRRLVGWLGGLRRERDRWSQKYERSGQKDFGQESSFARWVHEREPHAAVIDVGCGIGDDTVYFAEQGHEVVAVDFAPNVLRTLRSRARKAGLDVERVNCNLYSVQETLLLGARLAHRDGPRAVYARDLLAGMREDGRELFWRLTRQVLSGGGRCYVEVPSESAAGRRPNSRRLRDEAVRHGARVVSDEGHVSGAESGRPGGRASSRRLVLEWKRGPVDSG